MFLLTIVGLAFWRRRRTARTRAEAAQNDAEAGVAVIYNPNHGPEEAAVVINLPIRPVRRSFRAAHAPIRFPEGVAGL
jgi:hypothetical protein